MEFKNELKSLRKSKGLSQQELADRIHISRSAIAKWENGLGHPSPDAMEALLHYFGIDSSYFKTEPVQEQTNAVHPVRLFQAKPWRIFCKWFTITVSSMTLLFLGFCLLTQWKCISLPTDGITVKYIYAFPDGRILYALDNIPEGLWCSTWEFVHTENGASYKIPKRSVIELNKEMQRNQLLYPQMIDCDEQNAANEKIGLPTITKWYLGEPGNAILIYAEGTTILPATEELLRKYGYLTVGHRDHPLEV